MFRRILIIFGLVVICALFSGYFYHVGRYASAKEAEMRCDTVQILFKGDPARKFITEDELRDVVRPFVIGKTLNGIDTESLEEMVSETGVICHAEVYPIKPTSLVMEVEQRNPIVRICTDAFDCYADSCGYLLPLIDGITLDLPVLSGKAPLVARDGIRGFPASGREWLMHTLSLTETIRLNSYWSEEIEQIWVNDNADFVLFARSIPESFIFGQIGDRSDIQAKLNKMAGYYRTIRPKAIEKNVHYNTVNLKYNDQIICK